MCVNVYAHYTHVSTLLTHLPIEIPYYISNGGKYKYIIYTPHSLTFRVYVSLMFLLLLLFAVFTFVFLSRIIVFGGLKGKIRFRRCDTSIQSIWHMYTTHANAHIPNKYRRREQAVNDEWMNVYMYGMQRNWCFALMHKQRDCSL